MTTDEAQATPTGSGVPSSEPADAPQVVLKYKQAKNLAAERRRDGTNPSAFVVYDVARSMWTVG